MRNIFFLLLFLTTSLFAGTEAIIKADQADGLESVKNYMKEKAHFEKNVNGWSAYADAAGTRPVDGTGGSPTITCTRSTTSPITGDGSLIITKDAANRQGQGCAATFTIGNEMKAKVMQIEMDYRVVSGTFVAGSSTADSDLIVYLYDQTNSTLIEPSSIKFLSTSTTLPDKFIANFQTSATGTTYNLIIHQATTSASAFVVMLDNVVTKASRYVYGTPIFDWTSYTPTGSWVSNATYTGRFRQVGDEREYDVAVSTTGAPTSALLTVNLPTGHTIDTTKLATTTNKKIGWGTIHDTGTDEYEATVFYSSTTAIAARVLKKSAGNDYVDLPAVSATQPMTWATGDSINLQWKVPIVGLSSSVQMSDGYDGREISFSANTSTTAATTSTPFIYTNVLSQKGSGYNSATGVFTAPSAGSYAFVATIYNAGSHSINFYKNGVSLTQGATLGTAANSSQVTWSGPLNAGDTIDVRPNSSITANGSAIFNTFAGFKILAPTTISATARVSAIYKTTSQSITNGGTRFIINASTLIEDTHGAVTTGASWKFTAQEPGLYEVKYVASHSSVTITTGASLEAEVYKNGSLFNPIGRYSQSGTNAVSPLVSGAINVPLNAGDYIDVREAVGGSVSATIDSATIYITKLK